MADFVFIQFQRLEQFVLERPRIVRIHETFEK